MNPANRPARIMFVDLQRSSAIIDAQTATGGLITLRVVLPRAGWAAVARWMLRAWAAAGSEVALELRQARGSAQVQISDNHSMLLLDLEPTPDPKPADKELLVGG